MNFNKQSYFQFWVTKFNFVKQQVIFLILQYLDRIIFLAVIIKIILDLVYLCQCIVDHMTVLNFCDVDALLQMSTNNTGAGSNLGTGANLNGNSGMPCGNGGNPGGLPGGNPEPFGNYNTNRQIINDDGSWSNTIRTLFIYGTGAVRLHLLRNGPPTQRFIVIGGALIADGVGRVIQNIVNDPNYVGAHATN
jgi:hypothetical protein